MKKSAAKDYFPSTFLKSINIGLAFLITIIIILVSVVNYYSTESLILDRESKSNRQSMLQLLHTIELMDESVKNSCKSLFSDDAVISLMYENSDDNMIEMNQKLKTVNTFVLLNGFIDSVYIYNYLNDEFCNYTKGIINDSSMFEEELRVKKIIPVLKPIILQKNIFERTYDGNGENSLTYFMYEHTDSDGKPYGALIVNIKSKWIVNNLLGNPGEKQSDSSNFIFNEEGDILGRSGTDIPDDSLQKLFNKYKLSDYIFSDGKNYIKENILGINYLITVVFSQKANMVILKTQKYVDVFKDVDRLRWNILLLTLVFLILAVFISRTVARRIYKPLGMLVSKLKSNYQTGLDVKYDKNEFTYINDVFMKFSKQIDHLEKDRIEFKTLIKSDHLKKLLNYAGDMKEDDILKTWEEYDIKFDIKGKFAICLMVIDGYKSYECDKPVEERRLIKFAIINIACEVLSNQANAEGVDIDEDKVAIILSFNQNVNLGEEHLKALENSIQLVQHNMINYFNVSVSASLSEYIGEYTWISEAYVSTLQNSYYRLIYGKKCIINSEKIKNNKGNNRRGLSADFEKRLSEGINIGDYQRFKELFKEIIVEASGLNYRNIIITLYKIADIIGQSVEHLNVKGTDVYQQGLFELGQKVFELETMDEFYERTMELLQAFFEKRNQYHSKGKYQSIAVNIREYICNNLDDYSLCLAVVSSNLNMSQAYVGRIFKEDTGMSVSEFINKKRLEKAAMLLLEANCPITDVLVKVGMENEKYFYSLFKKKFGVTPKEYILRSKMKE